MEYSGIIRFPHSVRGQLIVPGLHDRIFTESRDTACVERIPGGGKEG